MKKRITGKKLSRSRTARDALYRSLTKALVDHGKIKTTHAKAKGVQRYLDKLVSKAKRGTLSSQRQILASLANDKKTTQKIMAIAKQSKRNSGFTRIIRLPKRKGDAAEVSRIEWVDQLSLDKREQVKGKQEKKGETDTKKPKREKPEEKKKLKTKTNKKQKKDK